MTAQRVDITIEQGADYDTPFPPVIDANGNPVDITGWAFAMQFRTTFDDPTALFTLTTAGGGLTNGGTNGKITPTIDNTMTMALIAMIGVYDVKGLDSGGKLRRTHQGTCTVSPEVTLTDPAPFGNTIGTEGGDTLGTEGGDQLST